MPSSKSFDLARFVTAQEGVFETALAELKAGRKQSHWMWFIFPQLRGLGHSPTAYTYGISSQAEAQTYLDHPLLGPRLERCTEAALSSGEASLRTLFGTPDDLKFCSSMTLFAHAAGGKSVYRQALDYYCDGQEDQRMLQLL